MLRDQLCCLEHMFGDVVGVVRIQIEEASSAPSNPAPLNRAPPSNSTSRSCTFQARGDAIPKADTATPSHPSGRDSACSVEREVAVECNPVGCRPQGLELVAHRSDCRRGSLFGAP